MWFVLALALAAQQEDTRPGAKQSVEIPRLNADITVDGNLDEPVWQQAARLTGFRQREPVDGRPAVEETEVLVWYAPDAIHFGIIAHDSEPGSIRATRADRDRISNEDHVVIYLDTFNDRRRAFFFSVNALGVQGDGVQTEGAGSAGRSFGGNSDSNPDYVFDSHGRITGRGYEVEIRIPFKSLRYPGNGPQTWGLQIERKTQRTGFTDTWTDVRRANASFLSQSGTITGLHDLERGVVLEAQPFVTTSANGARLQTGAFTREDPQPDAGLNLRVGFTNVAVDATVNPDFSQVESDASQVTINERFALFVPEKRPFFLEGIELFNVPGQLVYTRQVVDPIAGGKVTGKFGALGVAHLTAIDQDVNAAGSEALFNITRVRRDFGANNLAGLLFTDRTLLEGNEYNRVAAGDVRVVFNRLYFVQAQAGYAWTRDESGFTCGTGQECSGAIWRAELDRTGRRMGFNWSLDGKENGFVTRSGFVNRTGIVNFSMFNRLTWYGAPGATLETMTLNLRPSRLWRYDEFGGESAIEGGESLSLNFRLRGGWSIDGSINRNFVDFDPLDYTSLRVGATDGPTLVPYDNSEGFGVELSARTPTFQKFNANVSFEAGHTPLYDEGASGKAVEVSAGASLRPTERIRISADAGYNNLHRDRDDSFYARTALARLTAEYQVNRALFFRAIGDAQFERRAELRDPRTGMPLYIGNGRLAAERDNELRIDLLASYEPTPGTVAFFGYGASLNGNPEIEDLRRYRDGFFVKLAYQFRR